jgi:hypothetical protein
MAACSGRWALGLASYENVSAFSPQATVRIRPIAEAFGPPKRGEVDRPQIGRRSSTSEPITANTVVTMIPSKCIS